MDGWMDGWPVHVHACMHAGCGPSPPAPRHFKLEREVAAAWLRCNAPAITKCHGMGHPPYTPHAVLRVQGSRYGPFSQRKIGR